MAQVSMEEALGSPSAQSDRRRSERQEFVVRVAYATIDELFSEFSRDINEGGLFIETERPRAAGTEVSMCFTLPGSDDVVETRGRVVRVSDGTAGEPAGMGIEFDPLNRDASVAVDRLVRSMRIGAMANNADAA